jgi:acetyl esterase/lipase
VLSGDSAGANLAAIGGVIATVDGFAENIGAQKPPIVPAGLLLCCGPYEIESAMNAKVPLDIINKIMLESTGYQKKEIGGFKYLHEFSPIPYITPAYPKTFLIYSLKDIFCKHHSELLEERLKENNVSVKSFHSTKFIDNHCFHLNHSFKASKQAITESTKFLNEIAG